MEIHRSPVVNLVLPSLLQIRNLRTGSRQRVGTSAPNSIQAGSLSHTGALGEATVTGLPTAGVGGLHLPTCPVVWGGYLLAKAWVWDFAETADVCLALGLLLPDAFPHKQHQYGHGELKDIKLDYQAPWVMVKDMGARWYLLNPACHQLILQLVVRTGIL